MPVDMQNTSHATNIHPHSFTSYVPFSGCDDSCEGNCTGEGPKRCLECASGYVKNDEEECKG